MPRPPAHGPRALAVHRGDVSGYRCWAHTATDITINGKSIDPHGTYAVAVNDYIAKGGSGFNMLKRNTTREETGISLRDSLIGYMQGLCTCEDILAGRTESSTTGEPCGVLSNGAYVVDDATKPPAPRRGVQGLALAQGWAAAPAATLLQNGFDLASCGAAGVDGRAGADRPARIPAGPYTGRCTCKEALAGGASRRVPVRLRHAAAQAVLPEPDLGGRCPGGRGRPHRPEGEVMKRLSLPPPPCCSRLPAATRSPRGARGRQLLPRADQGASTPPPGPLHDAGCAPRSPWSPACAAKYGNDQTQVPAGAARHRRLPLRHPPGEVDVELSITALDHNGNLLPGLQRPAGLPRGARRSRPRPTPGAGCRWSKGYAEGTVRASHVYGEVRVWVEDAPVHVDYVDGGVRLDTNGGVPVEGQLPAQEPAELQLRHGHLAHRPLRGAHAGEGAAAGRLRQQVLALHGAVPEDRPLARGGRPAAAQLPAG